MNIVPEKKISEWLGKLLIKADRNDWGFALSEELMDSITKPDAEHRKQAQSSTKLKPKAGTNVQSHFTDVP